MSLDICILDAGYGVVDVYVIKRAERSEVRGFLPKKNNKAKRVSRPDPQLSAAVMPRTSSF